MLPDVLDYLDYREFLRDWYQENKRLNRFTSYRYISRKTGLDPAWIVRVLQKEGHLSEESLPQFIKLCNFDNHRAEYFKVLHRFCKAKLPEQQKEYYRELMELRELDARTLQAPELEFYRQWFVPALRALIGIMRDTGDPDLLARQLNPPISREEAEMALSVLRKLGLIESDGRGGWNITDKILTTGPEVRSHAVRNYHQQSLRLAMDCVERHAPLQRDVSTVVLTLDDEEIEEVKERIAIFRRGLLQFARQSPQANRVYQLSVAFFPLSARVENPAGEES